MLIKQPSETRALAIPFGTALSAVISVTATSRGLVAGSVLPVIADEGVPVSQNSFVAFTASGGTDGERYLLTARASTAAGETRERDIELAVIDLAWETPAAGAYLTPAALIERATLSTVTRLTDDEGLGRIDAARLAGALADAAAEIDSHVSARYALPLSQPWPLLATIAFDLAMARLWQGRGDAPDSVTAAASTARAQLKLIADGRMAAPAGTATAAAEAQPQPVIFQPGATAPTLSSRTLRNL
jgi:phage gp36-like protein